nr:hypothetical protein [Tanacetum cinerariifolium]
MIISLADDGDNGGGWQLAMVNMHSLRSKVDDVQKISSSVFVTNFLSNSVLRICGILARDSGKNNYQRFNKGTNVSNGGDIKNGGGLNRSDNSYASVVKKPTGVKETIDSTPTMVLDES